MNIKLDISVKNEINSRILFSFMFMRLTQWGVARFMLLCVVRGRWKISCKYTDFVLPIKCILC